MPERELVGLDIGSKFVKAIQLAEDGGSYTVTGYGKAEINPEDSIPNIIKGLFSSRGFKTKRVCSSVSGKQVVVRYIPMPVMNEKTLRGQAKDELTKYVPFEAEEVYHDVQILEEIAEPGQAGAGMVTTGRVPTGKEMRVLLVAAKKALIDEHVNILEQCGLLPAIVDIDSFALGNAYELTRIVKPPEETDSKLIALIEIGATKTNINMMMGPISYFTREFYKGGNDLTEIISKKLNIDLKEAEILKKNPGGDTSRIAEAMAGTIDDICHDINISCDFFENQYDKKVETIYLTGGASKAIGLKEEVAKVLDRETFDWNPFEIMPMNLDPESQATLKDDAFQATIALGLASRIRKG